MAKPKPIKKPLAVCKRCEPYTGWHVCHVCGKHITIAQPGKVYFDKGKWHWLCGSCSE